MVSFFGKIHGQVTGNAKEDFFYGEFYVSQKMFPEAIPYYISSLKENSNNSNINYRIGQCYSNIIGEQLKALPYLKKAVLNVDKKYMEGQYKNLSAPIDSWLLLGDAYHRTNELTNASYAYNKYIELLGKSNEKEVQMIKKKLLGLGISYEFQRTENRLVMVNMGPRINSENSDYNPVVSGDQNTMAYTQFTADRIDKIMITHKTGNSWSVPADINDQVGSGGDCYTSAISYKGDELYIIKYTDNNYDIYVSKYVNGNWTKMTPISGKVNTKYQESSVCVSADGRHLYFSSDRPGGIGGFDLYFAEKVGNSWANIKNMGNIINSVKDEEGPYLTNDGKSLYLSSSGHETIGNMDIFCSVPDSNGNWGHPENIGFPVNTTNEDLFFTYFPDTETGFFSRDIAEGLGKNDIYTIVPDNTQNLTEGAFFIKNMVDAKLSIKDEASKLTPASVEVAAQVPVHKLVDLAPKNVEDTNVIDFDALPVITASSSNNSDNTVNEVALINTATEDTQYTTTIENFVISDTIYTIQILALKRAVNAKQLKITPLVVSAGDDGFYRYTTGEYNGKSIALSDLGYIKSKGFHDAFIRDIKTISNYAIPKNAK